MEDPKVTIVGGDSFRHVIDMLDEVRARLEMTLRPLTEMFERFEAARHG